MGLENVSDLFFLVSICCLHFSLLLPSLLKGTPSKLCRHLLTRFLLSRLLMTFVLLNPVSNSWLLSDLTCHVVWRSWLLLAGDALSLSSPCPPASLLSHRPPLHGLLSCLLTSLTFSCWRVPRHGLGSFYFPSIYTYSLNELIFSYGFKYKYVALMIPNFIFPARTAHLYFTLIC